MNEPVATPATAQPGVEWTGNANGGPAGNTGWPVLRPTARCDGENPMTGSPCINGDHKGYHRDDSDAEWLDD